MDEAEIEHVRARQKTPRQCVASGEEAVYDGRAMLWPVHFAMVSVTRLAAMTYLAVHGPTPLPRLAAACGRDMGCLHPQLHGLAGVWLVRCQWDERPPEEVRKGCARRRRVWVITEMGRKYLWRFGWLTRTLYPAPWMSPVRPDVAGDPVEGVLRHANRDFLRPTGMAIAWELQLHGGRRARDVARWTGQRHTMVMLYLRMWQRHGYAQKRPGECGVRWRWSLTPEGLEAIERHSEALRQMAEASGYEPTVDDLCHAFVGLDDAVVWSLETGPR